jgi:hypothetical protein
MIISIFQAVLDIMPNIPPVKRHQQKLTFVVSIKHSMPSTYRKHEEQMLRTKRYSFTECTVPSASFKIPLEAITPSWYASIWAHIPVQAGPMSGNKIKNTAR